MKCLLIYKQINLNEELNTQYLHRIINKIKLSKCLNNKVQENKLPTYNDLFEISTQLFVLFFKINIIILLIYYEFYIQY